jgi:alkanesulfonate monooxygenase SsuD/methylene tetrahydromethanopterin reductase-like flavin-dependent oxidoreductase (luciferase family)
MDIFEEHLEIITRMLAPGHATFEGRHAQVRDAINVPKGIQAHIPIVIGGNGPERTAGLAVRFGDELNFVYLTTEEVRARMADVRDKCERVGRDPSTLRFSLYVLDEDMRDPGQARVDILGAYAEVGLERIVCFPSRWDVTTDAQARFADDCRVAGLVLGPTAP